MQKIIFVILLIAASFLLAVGIAKTGIVKPSKSEIEQPKEKEYIPHWSCKPDSGEYGIRLTYFDEKGYTTTPIFECIAISKKVYLKAYEYSKQLEEKGFFVYFDTDCFSNSNRPDDEAAQLCATAVKWLEHPAIGISK